METFARPNFTLIKPSSEKQNHQLLFGLKKSFKFDQINIGSDFPASCQLQIENPSPFCRMFNVYLQKKILSTILWHLPILSHAPALLST